MKAFVYRAALWCYDCGIELRNKRTPDMPEGFDYTDESSYDSDDYPKGPYDNGGGESDCPQHCEGCGVFLQNPLTGDGDAYVREEAAEFDLPDSSWGEIAARADNAGRPVLAEWIRYYFAPGM